MQRKFLIHMESVVVDDLEVQGLGIGRVSRPEKRHLHINISSYHTAVIRTPGQNTLKENATTQAQSRRPL